jgi:lysophospholipase L1-like esterase
MPASTITAPPLESTQKQKPPKKKGVLRFLAEIAFFLIVAALALETYFGLVGVGEQEARIPDKALGWKYPPHQLISYRREGFSHEKTNSTGQRDIEHTIAKPPSVIRIALLGDSATAAMQVPMEETTARQVERDLNAYAAAKHIHTRFEVLNFGCLGYSIGQELVLYESVVAKYQPDVVVMLYTAGDAGESVLPWEKRLTATPRPYFYLDSKGQLKEDKSVLSWNDEYLSEHPLLDYLTCHSHIFGILSQTDLELSINEPAYKRLRDMFMKRLEKFQRPRTVAPDAMPEVYFLADRIKVGEAIFTRLNEQLKQRHGRFVIYCFPNAFDNKEFYEDARIFGQFAKDNDIPFLDLDPLYKNSADPKSLILQQHFSSKGHKFAAEKLEELIAPLCFPQSTARH